MADTLVVANVNYPIPDDLHRRAKAAAALEGVTLKEFVVAAIEEATRRAERRHQRRRH